MSTSPSGTSRSRSSESRSRSRRARIAPRRWMPASASSSGRLCLSTISCAMRTSARRKSSPPRTTFSVVTIRPSWPHGTGLKDLGGPESSSGPGGGSLGRLGSLGTEAVQLGLALLRQRHLDGVEVARDLGAGEDGARLLADVAGGVAGGEVGQGEQVNLRLGGQLGRLARGAVAGLLGAREVLVQER